MIMFSLASVVSPGARTSTSRRPTTLASLPSAAYGMAKAQGLRETMEDDGSVVTSLAAGYDYVGVFDGHGGDPVAHWLASHLHLRLVQILENQAARGMTESSCPITDSQVAAKDRAMMFSPTPLRSEIHAAFQQIDAEIIRHLQKTCDAETAKEAGATATILLARDDRLVVANVGDSRCVVSRGGRAVQLSVEHRLYGSGPEVRAEVARVESVGGWVDDWRLCGILVVARSFGDWEWKGPGLEYLRDAGVEWGSWDEETAKNMVWTSDPVVAEPAVTQLNREAQDEFVVLASDGLWDVYSSLQVVQQVRKGLMDGGTSQEAAEALLAGALKKGTEDNVTVAVVDLLGEKGWTELRGAKKKVFGLF